eukprot:CAMPEP_0114619718 /NCGR_PEP_ID=MMETSP0168-20121206/8354_1 /TAXON_ID=95228 ORGANISM="Vannella sp., Strain DIVA3 517/6/12" /NCGR_SAMPLE_ID=MMETSP0168 /ASSEMBLY_ACC=CAM_ASM_000044 /LENGTH=375 /DNA_ID=CAMNT_0001830887 /DNA_START=101 /DNA_END=1223 /DNA_ORIENTATION=+
MTAPPALPSSRSTSSAPPRLQGTPWPSLGGIPWGNITAALTWAACIDALATEPQKAAASALVDLEVVARELQRYAPPLLQSLALALRHSLGDEDAAVDEVCDVDLTCAAVDIDAIRSNGGHCLPAVRRSGYRGIEPAGSVALGCRLVGAMPHCSGLHASDEGCLPRKARPKACPPPALLVRIGPVLREEELALLQRCHVVAHPHQMTAEASGGYRLAIAHLQGRAVAACSDIPELKHLNALPSAAVGVVDDVEEAEEWAVSFPFVGNGMGGREEVNAVRMESNALGEVLELQLVQSSRADVEGEECAVHCSRGAAWHLPELHAIVAPCQRHCAAVQEPWEHCDVLRRKDPGHEVADVIVDPNVWPGVVRRHDVAA